MAKPTMADLADPFTPERASKWYRAMRHFWHPVAYGTDVADGEMMSGRLLGERILIVRHDGTARAFMDVCRHKGAAPSLGWIENGTGEIRIEDYVVVHDCGTMVNPMIIDGQVHGGVAQGIAGAMYEHFQYDPETARPRFASFMEYLYPTCAEVPEMTLDHFETPAPEQPLGVKGCGEGGTIGPAAVVAGAVSEALADLGVDITATPVTPSAVRQAIREAAGGGATS